jgi:acetyltransferase
MMTITLADGARVGIRPIRPEDAPALSALYARLSPETAYQRFFTVMRRLPPDWARILARVDYDRRMALVAVDPAGELIGVARYTCEEPALEAELAVVVQDAWQGRGLGTVLLRELVRHGVARGITRYCAYVLADNGRMLRLFDRLMQVRERRTEQGVTFLRLAPPPAPPPVSP